MHFLTPSEQRRTNGSARRLLSRLDDKRTGAIVIVMQRVHMDDLTGFATETSDEWEILSLPAIAEAPQDIPLLGGRTHCRKLDDVLSPVREPLLLLHRMRQQLGPNCLWPNISKIQRLRAAQWSSAIG